MTARAIEIQKWINSRKANNEITRCFFTITVPDARASLQKEENETIRKVIFLLEKYHISYRIVDTVIGAWNLNRDWIETDLMDCIVEYCGVYPIDWDAFDLVILEQMETSGEIIIHVTWVNKDGSYEPNH